METEQATGGALPGPWKTEVGFGSGASRPQLSSPPPLLPGLSVRALAGCEGSPRPAWELATGCGLFIIPEAHCSASM